MFNSYNAYFRTEIRPMLPILESAILQPERVTYLILILPTFVSLGPLV